MRIASFCSPLVLLLSVACTGDKDTTETPDTDTETDTETVEDTVDTSDPGPDLKLATEVRFVGFIAWDAAKGVVRSPIIDGNDGFISAFVINLYEKGAFQSGDDSGRCRVSVNLEGYVQSGAALKNGWEWGLDIPEGPKKGTFTDCIDQGFSAVQFTKGDPLQDWEPIDWALRMGGARTAELEDWLTPDDTKDFEIDWYKAGAWSTETGGFSTDDDNNFWYGYAMDDKGNVDFDTRPLEGDFLPSPGQLATGYYVFDQRVFWNIDPSTTKTPPK
ncbi:MAG: hypothetical protein KTR31_37230 [Myxococcales bacterium]|nr:hypothetical protein [Myxococcales bacterium]